MPNTKDVISAARGWIGTPYVHQHRALGLGCDCVGLIIGVGLEAGVLPTWTPEAWRPHRAYGRAPNPAHMKKAIAEFLEPIDCAPQDIPDEDGAVAFMGWRADLPMHLAISSSFDGRRTMIHAHAHIGSVREHDFSPEWRERVISWWRYPGLR
jgi:NlpC/P60 family putative phage cell wall peptidase